MLLPPPDLNHPNLRQMLAEQFGAAGQPEFVPVGEDSWSYRLGDLWISVRRDLRGHNPAAYATAYRLRLGGLGFVLAPVPGADGELIHTVCGYPVVVFPYERTRSLDPDVDSQPWCQAAVTLIRQVHDSDPGVTLPHEDYRLSFDGDLDQVLDASAWRCLDAGPFSAPLGRLLRAHRRDIASMRAELAELAQACAACGDRLVLTHGEPRAQNILRSGDRLLLADWGEVMWGPPERDWFHVLDTLGTAPRCRPEFLKFYRLRWELSEIAEYVTKFLAAHEGDRQDSAMWDRLTALLPVLVAVSMWKSVPG